MFQVKAIPAFYDNYIWCIHDDRHNAVVIDPGCANSTQTFLETHQLDLSAILITHHHPDHIGGVNKLKQQYNLEVFGFKDSALKFLDHRLAQNDTFSVLGINFTVMEVPGHTLDHIAFYTETEIHDASCADSDAVHPALFCGDTLFSGGCGRLFEGSADQMYASLLKIAALPPLTRIYCAHEYTLSNLKFARALMPSNSALRAYQDICDVKRQSGDRTIPVSLETEQAINPFLRCKDPELIEHLQTLIPVKDHHPVEIFRQVRKAKDNF